MSKNSRIENKIIEIKNKIKNDKMNSNNNQRLVKLNKLVKLFSQYKKTGGNPLRPTTRELPKNRPIPEFIRQPSKNFNRALIGTYASNLCTLIQTMINEGMNDNWSSIVSFYISDSNIFFNIFIKHGIDMIKYCHLTIHDGRSFNKEGVGAVHYKNDINNLACRLCLDEEGFYFRLNRGTIDNLDEYIMSVLINIITKNPNIFNRDTTSIARIPIIKRSSSLENGEIGNNNNTLENGEIRNNNEMNI